jgi:Pentapeptide repeats (8 copies)
MQIFPADFFPGREFSIEPDLCFVVMPFAEPWSNRTFTILKETLAPLGYRCVRADDVYGRVVLTDIWDLMNRAAFVIADLTAGNPNVYYELGMAHTLGKDVIPLLQSGERIPFDQRPFRILFYEDNRDGEAVLARRLPEWVAALGYRSNPQMLIRSAQVPAFNQWRSGHEAPQFIRCDFSGLSLVGIDLHAAHLSETSFKNTKMRDANLTGAVLIRCTLIDADLSGATLVNANLSEADLTSADLSNSDLSGALLLRVRLDGAKLSGAVVGDATIDRATFEKYAHVFKGLRGGPGRGLIVEDGQ